MNRSNYIDNIRIICILLLFPFHTAMCFNSFGEKFYVMGTPSTIISGIVVAVYPWWMALLFVLAGISSVYALKKRSASQYAKERVFKLFIPLLFGILLIIPPQTYIADVFHNSYSGGYFKHYITYFTKWTDLSGADGGFTPGHLWFILYLFVISMITLPLMNWYTKREKKLSVEKINIFIIALIGIIIITLMTFIADIGGKSVGDFAACFLLGFFLLSKDDVIQKLEKHSTLLGITWLILIVIRCVLWLTGCNNDIIFGVEYKALEWIGILAFLGLGKRFLNFRNKITDYLSKAAFPLYFLHQTILIITGFFVFKFTPNIVPLQYLLILFISFVFTLFMYELFRRIPVTRFMFGIKK